MHFLWKPTKQYWPNNKWYHVQLQSIIRMGEFFWFWYAKIYQRVNHSSRSFITSKSTLNEWQIKPNSQTVKIATDWPNHQLAEQINGCLKETPLQYTDPAKKTRRGLLALPNVRRFCGPISLRLRSGYNWGGAFDAKEWGADSIFHKIQLAIFPNIFYKFINTFAIVYK